MEYAQYEFFNTTPTTTTTTTPTTTTTTPATTTTTTPTTTPTTPPPTTPPPTTPPPTTPPPTTPPPTTTTTSSTPAATSAASLPVYYDSRGNRVYYDRFGNKYTFDVNNPPNANIMYPPPIYEKNGNRIYYDRNGNKFNFDVNNPPKPSDIYPPPRVNTNNRYADDRYYRDNTSSNNSWGWGSYNDPHARREIDVSVTRNNTGLYNNQAIVTSAGWSMFGIFILIIGLIWSVAGFTAFFASVICLFYNGSITDKSVGVILSILLGPFYWLYYIYNMNYCTRYY